MEESEKRRERLKAMRLEATVDAKSSSYPQPTLNSTLPAPLLDNQDSNTAAVAAIPPPRFDYYTDPMAAYSTDKRQSFTPRPHISPSPQASRNNPQMSQPGAPQFQHNIGPHQGMYQGGDSYYNPGMPNPNSSPMGIRSHPGHQGSPNFGVAPGRGYWFNNNRSHDTPGACGGSPYPPYQGSPNIRSPHQGWGNWSNSSSRPPSPSPGFGGGPSPSIVRGRGWWDVSRMSPCPGYSGGRGRGRSHDYGQARSFYNKSMVEDPWASLTPVIWQEMKENYVKSFANNQGHFQKSPAFQKTPTFQKTPNAKKARFSNFFDASNSNKSGSLAEYLAESFDEGC